MGELFAVLSAVLFGIANIMVSRGASTQSEDNGAFISIVLTAVLSGLMYLWGYAAKGVPTITSTGLYWFAVAGLLTVFLGRVLVYASVQYLGAVRASAVKRLNPFFAVLLAVLILGEPLTGGLVAGMGLIFASFILLIQQSLAAARSAADVTGRESNLWLRTRRAVSTARNLGYFYGPVSALSYAIGYIGRKQGLIEIPDPFFGTLIGAIVGVLAFLVAALFFNSYRTALRSAMTKFNGWLFAGGLFSSLGQICTFIALDYTTISRVALIGAMEVFITMFLSVWLFRARERMGVAVVSAAAMGVVGTAFIVWE